MIEPNSDINVLSEFPFFTLDSQEFLKTTGGWVHQSHQIFLEAKDLFKDIIISPESEREIQDSAYNDNIESQYYSIKRSGNFLHANEHCGFSMIHLNMHSLSANLTSLEDVLSTVKSTPDIIAMSETKLKYDNIYNINIPGYVFVNTNSPTSAGWVGIYISQELELVRRRGLEIAEGGIESCWIEITRT